MDPIKLNARDVPNILRTGYTGRKLKLVTATEVIIPEDANVWDGGSKTSYKAIRLENGAQLTLGDHSAPWDNDRKDMRIIIQPGFVVVMHVIFQGKDLGLTFYTHPDNVAKFLPRRKW